MTLCDQTNDLFAYADDNRPSIVYVATNAVNGKQYIGITRLTLDGRRKAHFKEAKWGRHKASPLYKAIRRYGEGAFDFRIIQHCDSYKAAADEEIRLIAELRPAYNLSPGGDGLVGYRPSAETLKKLSDSHKGQIGNWLGKKRPDIAEKQRARLLANPLRPMLGKKHSLESREKMSKTHKARGLTERQIQGNARRRVPVMCVDDGRVFSSVKDAALAFAHEGLTQNGVFDVIRGKCRTHKGRVFKRLRDMA